MTVKLDSPQNLQQTFGELRINSNSLFDNVSELRKKSASTRLMAMIKANGYGTDSLQLGQKLREVGIDIFGLAYTTEAIYLREQGFTEELFVIHAEPKDAPHILSYDLSVAVSKEELLDSLEEASNLHSKKAKVHLHVNTGMNRLGCSIEDAVSLAKRIHHSNAFDFQGLMTHFPAADDPEQDPFTLGQIRKLKKIHQELERLGISPPWVHGANSSAFLRMKTPFFNMARVGLSLFGAYNTAACRGKLPLKPALSLVSEIIDIHNCNAGDSVSYNRSYFVKSAHEKIAVIPLGYHDGLPRSLSGKGVIKVRGFKAPIVGKICMDFFMANVTEVPLVNIGDKVLLFGEDEFGSLEIEKFAESADTIAHEIISRLGPRIKRCFY